MPSQLESEIVAVRSLNRRIWALWGYIAVFLALGSIGFLALAIYSFLYGDVAFGLVVATFGALVGFSIYVRAGLGALSTGLRDQARPEERPVPSWSVRIVRAGPWLWGIAGGTVLAAGVLNAVREGDATFTILCFIFGGPLLSITLTYAVIRLLFKRLGEHTTVGSVDGPSNPRP